MLWYHERLQIIDYILSIFIKDPYHKWLLLSILHYVAIAILILVSLLFAKGYYLYSVIGVLILVAFFNYIDNGCILLKLERRYVGKQWYGNYSLIEYLCPGSLNQTNVDLLYYLLVMCIVCVIVFRLLGEYTTPSP